MNDFTLRSSTVCISLLVSFAAGACKSGDASTEGTEGVDGSPVSTAGTNASGSMQPSAAGSAGRSTPSGTSPAASSGVAGRAAAQTGAASAAGAGGGAASAAGSSAGSGAVAGSTAAAAAAAGSGVAAGAGAVTSTAGASAAGGGAAGTGSAAAGQGAAGSSSGSEATAFASGLHELFIDAACDSEARAPLEMGATCNHASNMQRIEKMVTFGGEAGKSYKVTLRVRGIWEPTNIMGGMRPNEDAPFTVGGQVASGAGSSSDSINYQQYFIEVAQPKQTYWLNDHQYVAHDIHKEDYEASITVGGGAQVKVVMNDGNEREIANFPKEMFSDLPPYDKMPTLGQLLRLDVVSVEVSP